MHEVSWGMRARDTIGGLRLAKAAARVRSRAELERRQASALRDLLAHAAAHSPYYRERFRAAGVTPDSPLDAVPTLDKTTMAAEFDRIVCDERLRSGALREFIERGPGDVLFAGEFRVLRTGGSSRVPGLFVYDRADWRVAMGNLFHAFDLAGIKPRLPRRLRAVTITAPGALHMASRMAQTSDIGLNATARLDATAPLEQLVARTQAHRPDVIAGYPSVIALLAAEQLEGRLDVAPSIVITSSEPRTPEMTERIRRAWGVEAFDMYATTESAGPLAVDCEHHRGLHLFENSCVVEVVDEDLRPVPIGEVGARVLVTNLHARTQPIVRMEVTDMVRMLDEPCACGRPHRLIEPVQGRSDDVLELPGSAGGTVRVHPMTFAPLGSIPGVHEFEVIQRSDGLQVRVVAPDRNGAAEHVSEALRAALAPLGVAESPAPRVELVGHLTRDASRAGKAKLVRRELT